jgi:hypothetical protein
MFPLVDNPKTWTVPATGSLRKEAMTVEFETKQGPPLVSSMELRAALNERASAEVVEMRTDGDGNSSETHSEVVVFVDEVGDFWTNLEKMQRCTEEALARLK